MQLRVRGRVRVTEQDARAAYAHAVNEMGGQTADVRILVLRLLPGSTPQQTQARLALAQQLVAQARAGKDYCDLIKTYSDDATTRDSCGTRGPQPSNAFLGPLQSAVASLKIDEISDPITYPTPPRRVRTRSS